MLDPTARCRVCHQEVEVFPTSSTAPLAYLGVVVSVVLVESLDTGYLCQSTNAWCPGEFEPVVKGG